MNILPCINKESTDWKQLVAQTNEQLAKDTYATKGGMPNIIEPEEILNFIGLQNQAFIKPGVTELFESNLNKLNSDKAHKQIEEFLSLSSKKILQPLFQINKQKTDKLNKKLDNHLLDFVAKFGFSSEEFNSFKEKFDVDALGATDLLNKTIYYAKNRNNETVPEEVGHAIIMLLGENRPIIQDLLKEIHKWSEFKSIKEDYDPIYNNDKQVKIEAVGKLLAKSLVKQYKIQGVKSNIIERILNFFNSIMNEFNTMYNGINYSTQLADKIAVHILNNDYDFIDTLIPSTELLNYDLAIENNDHAKDIITEFGTNLNNKLVGSLAIAAQGENIYRDSKEPIHDLDFTVDIGQQKRKDLYDKLDAYGAIPIHSGWGNDNKNYSCYAFFIPKKGLKATVKKVVKGWVHEVELTDNLGNVVPSNSQNVIGVDFFIYEKAPNKDKFIGDFMSWQHIYQGKIALSKLGDNERMFQRLKDQKDYILAKPSNKDLFSKKEFIYFQKNTYKAPKTTQEKKSIAEQLSLFNEINNSSHSMQLNKLGEMSLHMNYLSKSSAIQRQKERTDREEQLTFNSNTLGIYEKFDKNRLDFAHDVHNQVAEFISTATQKDTDKPIFMLNVNSTDNKGNTLQTVQQTKEWGKRVKNHFETLYDSRVFGEMIFLKDKPNGTELSVIINKSLMDHFEGEYNKKTEEEEQLIQDDLIEEQVKNRNKSEESFVKSETFINKNVTPKVAKFIFSKIGKFIYASENDLVAEFGNKAHNIPVISNISNIFINKERISLDAPIRLFAGHAMLRSFRNINKEAYNQLINLISQSSTYIAISPRLDFLNKESISVAVFSKLLNENEIGSLNDEELSYLKEFSDILSKYVSLNDIFSNLTKKELDINLNSSLRDIVIQLKEDENFILDVNKNLELSKKDIFSDISNKDLEDKLEELNYIQKICKI
jgi:hypothetical protein